MPVDEFDQGVVELFLAAEDDVGLLHVRGKAQAVQFRPGRKRTPDIPGVDRAADGAMHQMQGVGNGIKHHPRAAEHAGPLAHRPGQAILVALHGKGGFPGAVYRILSFLQHCLHGVRAPV